MNQELSGIYPIVLPKPKEGFENRFYEILDTGWYELDRETKDATELIDNSILPVAVDEIFKIGKNELADDWAELIYFNVLSDKKCLHHEEYWQLVSKLPDFFAVLGSKQKMKDYLLGIDLATFLQCLDGMPVYRLNLPNPAIPNYNLSGKGYHTENPSDWINFDKFALLKCIRSLSESSKKLLGTKYLKSTEVLKLITELNNDLQKLITKQDGNQPNGHLIVKYDVENQDHLYEAIIIHVLEDFVNWLQFWSSKNYPIGLNTRFLIDR